MLLLYFLTLCAVACTSKPEGPTRLCAGHNNCPGFWLIIGASEGCCFGQDCWPGIVGRTRLECLLCGHKSAGAKSLGNRDKMVNLRNEEIKW